MCIFNTDILIVGMSINTDVGMCLCLCKLVCACVSRHVCVCFPSVCCFIATMDSLCYCPVMSALSRLGLSTNVSLSRVNLSCAGDSVRQNKAQT